MNTQNKTYLNDFILRNIIELDYILVLADKGWYLNSKSISSSSEIGKQIIKGEAHDYANQLKSIYALLIAKGPSFKKGIIVPPFDNINIYPMLFHILNITQSKNIDGNFKKIIHIFNT